MVLGYAVEVGQDRANGGFFRFSFRDDPRRRGGSRVVFPSDPGVPCRAVDFERVTAREGVMPVPVSRMWTVACDVVGPCRLEKRRHPLTLEPLFRGNLPGAGCGRIHDPPDVLKRQRSVEDCHQVVGEWRPRGRPRARPAVGRIGARCPGGHATPRNQDPRNRPKALFRPVYNLPESTLGSAGPAQSSDAVSQRIRDLRSIPAWRRRPGQD